MQAEKVWALRKNASETRSSYKQEPNPEQSLRTIV